MKWFEYAVAVMACILLASATPFAYSIQGDSVIEDNEHYRLVQTPHTLTDLTNYPVVSLWNKGGAKQVDVAFGFDTSNARPTQAWLWTQSAPHLVSVYGNVSRSYTCVSPNVFSYQLNPKFFWCNSTNGTVVFQHSFVNGWVANATAEWFELGIVGWEYQYWPDWVEVSGAFQQVSWRGKTWFYRENVSFAANETKELKIKVRVQPGSNGKYDVFAKLSSDSFQEAFESGRYLLLDPWFNSSWIYRKAVNLTDSSGLERFEEPFVLNVTGLKLSTGNCSELRVTAAYSTETEVAREVLNASGQVFASGSQYCTIKWNINLTSAGAANATYVAANVTNYYVYYGNPAAPVPSYGNLTSWNATNYGDGNCTPSTCNGFTLQGGAGLSTYVYLSPNTTNYIWNYNTTSSYFYNYKVVASASRTMEVRGRWISGDNGDGAFLTIGAVGTGGSAHLLVNDSVLKVTGWDGNPYNFKVISNGLDFHVYRLLWNVGTNAYSAYQDGVLMTSGANATQVDGANRLYVGQVQDVVNVQNAEIDYFAYTENGLFPPLSSSLGSEESVSSSTNLSLYSPANAEYSVSSIPLSFIVTGGSNTFNCSYWLNGSRTDLGLIVNATPYSGVVTANVTGNYNFTITCVNGSSSETSAVNFNRTTSRFKVFIYDEATSTALAGSVLVSNSSGNYTSQTSYYFNDTVGGMATGLLTVVVNSSGYYSRTYSSYFDGSSSVTLNAYLLNASLTAIFVRFHVSNVFSQPVNNATILIQRLVNGSNVVVSSLVTDSYGLASDYLELGHSYAVLVYATGFNVYVSTISPVINDYYLTLVSSTNSSAPVYSTYDLNNTFGDAYWNLEPNTRSLSNQTTNVVFSVFSPSASLHYFGMNVSYANGSNICFENVTNSSAGGVVSCLVYMDNSTLGDNVSVIVWISRSPPWVSDFVFWFKKTASTSVNTLSDFYQSMRATAGGADSTAMAFLVIVVATIAGLFVYQYHKTGALLVMLAIMWFGAAEQFLNVNLLGVPVNGVYLMALITVAVVGVNFLKERV